VRRTSSLYIISILLRKYRYHVLLLSEIEVNHGGRRRCYTISDRMFGVEFTLFVRTADLSLQIKSKLEFLPFNRSSLLVLRCHVAVKSWSPINPSRGNLTTSPHSLSTEVATSDHQLRFWGCVFLNLKHSL
jgi:hypothetical protein